MAHIAKLGTAVTAGSTEHPKYLPDDDDQTPDHPEGGPDTGLLNRYLNYVLVGMGVLVICFLLINLVVGDSSRHGSIVSEIQQANALAEVSNDVERAEIMRQAARVDRAGALGNTDTIRRELEKLMMLDKGSSASILHRLCVKRLRSLK